MNYFTKGQTAGIFKLIPNGVDTDSFYPASNEQRLQERIKRKLPADKPVFIFAGRFVEKKGLNILHILAAKNPDATWIFAGWGPIDPLSWKLANVVVYNNLTAAELRPLYQLSDLLVIPSKGEGFPLVVQEAMACGTPAMVGTETSTALSSATFLLYSEDVEGNDAAIKWDTRIKFFINNPSSLSEMRSKVAGFAAQNWSWARCADEYEKIFRELAGKNQRS
jgi:glycosyltransferase involved in cell wall biosynthesis